MKRLNYFLAFIFVLAPIFYAQAETSGQSGAGTGDIIVTLKDFTLQPTSGQNNTFSCQLQDTSIEFKPEKGTDVQKMTTQQFCQLWSPQSSFSQTPPNATLTFHQGGDLYQMIFKIPGVNKTTSDSTVTVSAVAFDPQAAYTKNGQSITQQQFLSASQTSGKTNISLMIDNDPWDPRRR